MRERTLALAVASLFRNTKAKPQGTVLWEAQRELIAADRPLAAYFASVSEAGANGWAEERARMAARMREVPPSQRGAPLNVYAIAAMLAVWRAWGQVIIDMETSSPDLP